MRGNRIFTILVSLLTFLYFGYVEGLIFYESASIALFVFCLVDFLDNIGRRVVVLDIAVVVAVFTWLVMPVVFYHFYTRDFFLARIFYKYMPIPADEYFSFVLPGTLSMIAGFKIRLAKLEIHNNQEAYKVKLKNYCRDKAKVGFTLLGIGFVSNVVMSFLPGSLQHVADLAGNLYYVGVFFIYFSDHKYKNTILLVTLSLLVMNAISKGVFGAMIFLLALSYILIAIYQKKHSFALKLIVCIGGIFMIFVIQNVKKVYRNTAWTKGASTTYFAELVSDAVSNPGMMFQPKALYGTAVRMNQGWLIAVTMDRVPRKYSYANGETIAASVAAAFIPRIIWPDKPEAGGKYNLKRFWGFNLVGYSMNIGPIGEAYANFGTTGGIIFMFFYGLFFNAILTRLLKWSEKRPSVICWIPFLFFYAVVVETDILTTVGSIVTSFIFMLLFIRLYKAVFHVNL